MTPTLVRKSSRDLPILGEDHGSHVAEDRCARVCVREWSDGTVDCFVGVWDILGIDVPLPYSYEEACRWLGGLCTTPVTMRS